MSEQEIKRISQETKFSKIDSTLNGVTFLRELLRNSEQDYNMSLNQLSLNVIDKNGKPISKQAIDARFNEKSVDFIKKIFEAYLLRTNTLLKNEQDLGWMNVFKRVLIKDGTRFDLPAKLAPYFKGFGGSCSSESSICIQLEYDLKTGSIAEFKTTSANIPDLKDAQLTKDNIEEGDLILRDLGYFGLNIFEEMIDKNSYFISKLNTQVTVFEINNNCFEKLNFKTIKQRFNTKCSQIELGVYIGAETKIPVRLILEPVHEDIYEQRMRKAKKEAHKNGYQVSDEYAARQRFNCYITNISKDKLNTVSIRHIYRLRWQIELIFKVWKSTYKIETTQQMKYARWMTLFYARMFLMLIHWQFYNVVKQCKYKIENKLLSISKCMKTLRIFSSRITELVNQEISKIEAYVEEMTRILSTKHDLEKKKGRKNQEEIYDIIFCISTD